MKTLAKLYLMAMAVFLPTALLLGAFVALSFWGCAVTNHHLPKPWQQSR